MQVKSILEDYGLDRVFKVGGKSMRCVLFKISNTSLFQQILRDKKIPAIWVEDEIAYNTTDFIEKVRQEKLGQAEHQGDVFRSKKW